MRMQVQSKLKWSDVETTPVPGRDYIEQIPDKKVRTLHMKNMEKYSAKEAALQEIKEFLEESGEELIILVIGATWCPDCRRNVPRLVKIQEILGDDLFRVSVLGGVKTLPLKKRSGGPYVWAVPPSPPESTDSKFDVVKIPLIYLFRKDGCLIGRIVENPEHTDSLEEEIVHYLKL